MNTPSTIMLILLAAMMGCQQQRPAGQAKQMKMAVDTTASDKRVMMVHPNESLHPEEAIADLKELPHIMQYDLGAKERIPSKEIIYVKPGESVRPTEKAVTETTVKKKVK